MDVKAQLAPAAVLVLWTTLMLFWLAFNRFTSVAKLRGQLPRTPSGARGQDIDPHLSDRAKWASHNYTHLLEQPTIFYAVVLIIAVNSTGSSTTIWLAWAYTGLRIAHSIWQALVNQLPIRFALFLASSFCLVALAVIAVRDTLA
jgi:hypothetical protein